MNCAFCGKELPAGTRRHCRYCSATCRSKASYHRNVDKRRGLARNRYRRVLKTVTCPHCGEEFLQQRTDQTYCSKKCRNKAYKKRHRKEPARAKPTVTALVKPKKSKLVTKGKPRVIYHDVPDYPFIKPIEVNPPPPQPEHEPERRPWILENRMPTQAEMDALLDQVFA